MRLFYGVFLLLALTACHQESSVKSPAPARQVFSVTGLVQVLEPDGKTAVIQHAAIPNYMPAMTMPFTVKDANELRGLRAGDPIAFQLVITADDGWIEHVSKLDNAVPLAAVPGPSSPPPAQWRVVPSELAEGDRLPDYHFTNELGQAVGLSSYQGGVAVFTFFFTRCPYPTACPLLASKFSQVLEKLPQTPGAPARWRLLSISFDPANDTPAILKEYAQSCHYDPARWSFLTVSLADITDLADRCGEHFQITGETISHDFRTVVVDPTGRVRKIIPGNSWTSDDLIREILNAAK